MIGMLAALATVVALLVTAEVSAPSPAAAATSRLDSTTFKVVQDGSATEITSYRFVINADNTGTTGQRTPDGPCSPTDAGYPESCRWTSNGTASSSPVVTTGDEGDIATGFDLPEGRYLISVLADGYELDGLHFTVPFDGTLTLSMIATPLKTATIQAAVFEDISPVNGAPDAPAEHGLAGFRGGLLDYLGDISTDVFGNPLCTVYAFSGPNYFNPGTVDNETILHPGGNCFSYCYVVDNGIDIGITEPRPDGRCPVVDPDAATTGLTYTTSFPPASGTYTNTVPTTAAIQGKIEIPNMGPNRYAMTLTAPDGTSWAQTTTLEGNHDWDAWVMEGQTGLDTEFVVAGEPFPSIIFGYTPTAKSLPASGGATITGVVEAMKVYVPAIGGITVPAGQIWGGVNGAKIDKPIDQPWVALTDLDNGDTMVWVGRGNADGTFSIPDVPDGNYMLTWWDEPQNYILDWQNVTIVNGQSVDMGILPLTGWWTTYEGYVFNDLNRNGVKDAGEPGVPNYTLTMRKRENSLMDRGSNAVTTDANGYYTFESAYPMTQWLVMEAYNDLYYTTGVTYQADNQPQPTTVTGAGVDISTLPVIGLGGRIDWGVHSYDPRGTNGIDPRNGGIVGTVSYDTTRNELDPRYAAVEDWQPGVPDLTVELYEPTACPLDDNGDPLAPTATGYLPCDASGMYALAPDGSYLTGQKLNTYLTETWQRPGLNGDGECIPRNVEGDRLAYPADQQITDSDTDCLEAPLMGVQFQKGFSTVDGNYGFGDGCFAPNQLDPTAPVDAPVCLDPTGAEVPFEDLPGGTDYLVKVVVPEDTVQNDGRTLYQFTREEDINIANGDQIVPQVPPPACAGALHTVDVAGSGADNHPAVVGDGANGAPVGVTVPVSTPTDNPTFAADVGGSPYEGQARPLCDTKLVSLANGRSIVPTFNVFTDVPLPGRFWGLVVNDLGFSTDPHQINYGEKAGVPFVPVGIYDQNNRLVHTSESDYSGLFDVLMPSTNRINCPTPSGVCANVFRFVGNDPGVPGRLNINYNPRYRTIAADFEAWPGLLVPADLAPTQVGVTVQLPGGQVAPLACSADADEPQLYAIDKPYLGLDETHTFTLDGVGFGGTEGQVLLDGTTPMTVGTWNDTRVTFTVPAGTAGGAHQLSVKRSDNKKSTRAGLSFHVFGPAGLPAFPVSAVITDFNAGGGGLGQGWSTDVNNAFARDPQTGNRYARVRTGANTTADAWRSGGPATGFGTSQEAYVDLTQRSANASAQGLLLKYQGGNNPNANNAQWVQVTVADAAGTVEIRTKAGTPAITTQATFANAFGTGTGVLGARALPDGTIVAYKDGVEIGRTTVAATGAWQGRIGVRFTNTGTTAATEARFDDFGGGSVAAVNYAPAVYEVGPGKTYAPANTLPATANHAIQTAIDAAEAANPGNALVVVYPNDLQTSDPRINPRGAYYENLILNAPISLQGVGPGSPDGVVKGSIIDGGGFGGDSPVAVDWYANLNGLTWAGNQNVNDGAIISVFAPDTGPRAFGATKRAAIDGFDLRGGDQFGFPNNINVIGGGNTGLPPNVQTQGGAIFANGYARHLQITNNTVQNNGGAYGTIRIGTPDLTGPDANANNDHIRIANNRIVANGGTNLAGAIGLFEGSDNYTVSGNDICGNFSAEYGGALTVYGLSGGSNSIDHNRIWFNNSYDEAGGVMIAGELPATPGAPSPGSGPVSIHHNLIQENLGNDDGGGLRFLMSGNFPMEVYDNIIVNNVTTHEGGGVSINDAPDVRFVNNTVMGNLATATAATSDGQPAAAGLSFTKNSLPLQGTLAGNPETSPPVLRNNIFWDNRTGTKHGPGDGTVLVTGLGQTQSGDNAIDTWQIGSIDGAALASPTDSIIQADPNHPGTYTPSATNSSADPLVVTAYDTKVSFDAWRTNPNFVGALLATLTPAATRQGDYHIQDTSPAVDKGAAPAPATDYDDAARDTIPDAGADEKAVVLTSNASVAPTTLTFGSRFVTTTSPVQTVTVTNSGAGPLTGITVSASTGFARAGGANGGTCGSTLDAGASCTVGVTFTPTGVGAANGTLTIGADATVTGSPVALTGTGVAVPVPAVIDNFNRSNANTLGNSWRQLVTLGNAGIRVNGNQAFCVNSGLAAALCINGIGANAYRTTTYGNSQAAMFTYASTTVDGNWLWLKAGGTPFIGAYPNGIRVAYSGGQVTVASVTNANATVVGTFATTFASGDKMLAAADATGTVYVWKISGTTATLVGQASTTYTGGGFIGMHLAQGARVDDFAGGNV